MLLRLLTLLVLLLFAPLLRADTPVAGDPMLVVVDAGQAIYVPAGQAIPAGVVKSYALGTSVVVPVVPAAPPAPANPEDPLSVVGMLLAAVQTRKGTYIAAAALSALVWASRYTPWVKQLDKKWLPLVGLISSGCPALVLALSKPAIDPAELASATFAIYLMANGAWAGVKEPLHDLLVGVAAKVAASKAPPVTPVDNAT